MKTAEPKAFGFLFYARDWLASQSVTLMPLAAQGAYVRLMCHQWLGEGALPADPEQLRRLAGADPAEWPEMWTLLEPKFPLIAETTPQTDDNHGYNYGYNSGDNRRANPRIAALFAADAAYRAEQAAKGRAAMEKRWGRGETQPDDNHGYNNGYNSGGSTSNNPPSPSPSLSKRQSAKDRAGEPPEFAAAWAEYPNTRNQSRKAGLAKWRATLGRGGEPGEMLAGVRRYAALCVAERREVRYVLHFATFFGPAEHWRLPWELPAPSAGPSRADLLRKQGYFVPDVEDVA